MVRRVRRPAARSATGGRSYLAWVPATATTGGRCHRASAAERGSIAQPAPDRAWYSGCSRTAVERPRCRAGDLGRVVAQVVPKRRPRSESRAASPCRRRRCRTLDAARQHDPRCAGEPGATDADEVDRPSRSAGSISLGTATFTARPPPSNDAGQLLVGVARDEGAAAAPMVASPRCRRPARGPWRRPSRWSGRRRRRRPAASVDDGPGVAHPLPAADRGAARTRPAARRPPPR